MAARACRSAFAAAALLALTACASRVGPLELRIETGGEPVSDFVVEWSEIHGGLDGSDAVRIATAVVSSEEALVLPAREMERDVTEVIAAVYHPEFDYAYSGAAVRSGGTIRLPPVHPERWSAKLAAGEDVRAEQVAAHLERLRRVWAPAFDGERARLQRYLPGLTELTDAVRHADAAETQRQLAGGVDRLAEVLR